MENNEKSKGGIKRFFKAVFVSNIGYKIFAILFGGLLWVLAVGLL